MSNRAKPHFRKEAERVFAREIKDTTQMVRDTDNIGIQSPVLLPTGVTTRLVIFVGELVELTALAEGQDYWRGRLVGPTGLLFLPIGRRWSLDGALHPTSESRVFVSVVGSPRTARTPEGTEYVTVYPIHITQVGIQRLHQWGQETADRTLERIDIRTEGNTREATLAQDRYDVDVDRYREAVTDAREFLSNHRRQCRDKV